MVIIIAIDLYILESSLGLVRVLCVLVICFLFLVNDILILSESDSVVLYRKQVNLSSIAELHDDVYKIQINSIVTRKNLICNAIQKRAEQIKIKTKIKISNSNCSRLLVFRDDNIMRVIDAFVAYRGVEVLNCSASPATIPQLVRRYQLQEILLRMTSHKLTEGVQLFSREWLELIFDQHRLFYLYHRYVTQMNLLLFNYGELRMQIRDIAGYYCTDNTRVRHNFYHVFFKHKFTHDAMIDELWPLENFRRITRLTFSSARYYYRIKKDILMHITIIRLQHLQSASMFLQMDPDISKEDIRTPAYVDQLNTAMECDGKRLLWLSKNKHSKLIGNLDIVLYSDLIMGWKNYENDEYDFRCQQIHNDVITDFIDYPMNKNRKHYKHHGITKCHCHGCLIKKTCAKKFQIKGSLNGNNGEWTNTDDIDSGPTLNSMLDASNQLDRQLSKPGVRHEIQNRPNNGKQVNEICNLHPKCTRKVCRFLHPDNMPSKEMVVGEPTVIKAPEVPRLLWGCGYEWDESTLTAATFDEKYHFTRFRGTFNDGKLERSDTFNETGLFQEYYLHTFTSMGYTFTNSNVIVCNPLISVIQKTLGTPPHEMRNFHGIIRFLVKRYNNITIKICTDTAIYYCYILRGLSDTKSPMNWNDIASTAQHLDGVYNTGDVIVIPSVVSQFPNTWKYNRRWRITNSEGFYFRQQEGIISQYPTFKTDSAGVEAYGLRATAYCRTFGHIGSQLYAVCPENVTNAFSRPFKCRGSYAEEVELYDNQLIVCAHSQDLEDVLHLCEAKIVHEDDTKIIEYRYCEKSHGEPAPRRAILPKPSLDWKNFENYLCRRIRKRDWYEKLRIKILTYGREVFYSSISILVPVLKYIVDKVYTPMFYTYDKILWLQDVVTLPHPKRLLYLSWMNDYKRLFKLQFVMVNWQMKLKVEFGKYMKAQRFFVNSEENGLNNKIVPEALSQILSVPVVFSDIVPNNIGLRAEFIKSQAQSRSDSDKMYSAIKKMSNNTIRFHGSGDDGFTAYKDEFGNISLHEDDIENFDGSCGVAIFTMAYTFFKELSNKDVADALTVQCASIFTARNPANESEVVSMIPESFFLPSGADTTSAMGNLGNCIKGFSVYLDIIDGNDIGLSMKRAPNKVGYTVDYSLKTSYNKVTYLKRAYNGHVSWLVLGAIFRSLGIIIGQVDADKFGWRHREFINSIPSDQLERLLYQTVCGLKNEAGSPVLNALRERVRLPPEKVEVTYEDYIDRYGGELVHWHEFVHSIYNIRLGSVFSNDVTRRIFEVDYGIKKP